jgi:hypothetical protein
MNCLVLSSIHIIKDLNPIFIRIEAAFANSINTILFKYKFITKSTLEALDYQ